MADSDIMACSRDVDPVYQSCQDTTNYLRRRYFTEYIFLPKDAVVNAVQDLPDDSHGWNPDVPHEKNQDVMRSKTSRAIGSQ